MKKNKLFTAVFFLILLAPALITSAQSISLTGTVYENNTVKIPFTVPEGKITVYLPDDMASGDIISGTVSLEPEGKNKKEEKANLLQLFKYTLLQLDGTPLKSTANEFSNRAEQVNQYTFTGKIPDSKTNAASFQLQNPKGNIVSKADISLINRIPEGNMISENMLQTGQQSQVQKKVITSNEPLVVYSFAPPNDLSSPVPLPDYNWYIQSGDINTQVQPTCISPKQIILGIPPGISGPCAVIAKDTNSKTVFTDQVNVVNINASVGRSNLQRGEETLMNVTVEGLKNCPYPVHLVIVNKSSSVVQLEKGNYQTFNLDSTGGNSGGVDDYEERRTRISQVVTGKNPGNYNITATLVLPGPAFADIFDQQKTVLNSPEDFNAWGDAIKKDLKAYADNQVNDVAGKLITARAQNAIDNIPVCTDKSKLDECKAIAGAYLRTVNIPKGATTMWFSGLEAYKAAAKTIPTVIADDPQLIDWEVIKNGLDYINMTSKKLTDFDLRNNTAEAEKMINQIQAVGVTKDSLLMLKKILDEIDVRMNKDLMEMPALMKTLLPGGIFFSTKFTPPGTTTLKAEVTDIAWSTVDDNKDAIKIVWHFTGDIIVEKLSARVKWVSKDGKKSGDADFILMLKKDADFHFCDSIPARIPWPDSFTTPSITEPLPKDQLDLDKLKVIVFVNGEKIGEGKLED